MNEIYKMESKRKTLNKKQTQLRDLLLTFKQHTKAINLFLAHHSTLHSLKVNDKSDWSYEDEILSDLTEDKFRYIPANYNHSIAWCLWHLARIEDVTMNILIDNSSQILHKNNWLQKLNIHDASNET